MCFMTNAAVMYVIHDLHLLDGTMQTNIDAHTRAILGCQCQHVLECSLWPPAANTFEPKELSSVAAATVARLVKNNSKVLWVADVWGGKIGQWVSASDACFLLPHDMPCQTLIDVGKRAGLLIPDLPAGIYQVCTCIWSEQHTSSCSATNLTLLLLTDRASHL